MCDTWSAFRTINHTVLWSSNRENCYKFLFIKANFDVNSNNDEIIQINSW